MFGCGGLYRQSLFCSPLIFALGRPGKEGADKGVSGGVKAGWWRKKKVNMRRGRDWRGVDKWEPAALASGEEE